MKNTLQGKAFLFFELPYTIMPKIKSQTSQNRHFPKFETALGGVFQRKGPDFSRVLVKLSLQHTHPNFRSLKSQNLSKSNNHHAKHRFPHLKFHNPKYHYITPQNSSNHTKNCHIKKDPLWVIMLPYIFFTSYHSQYIKSPPQHTRPKSQLLLQ